MDCLDCERIDDIVFPQTVVWFWAPTDESYAKLEGLLAAERFAVESFGAFGCRATMAGEAVKRLAVVLMGALGVEELRGLKMATTPDENLGPGDLARFTTGAAFVARADAEWLIDSLREERFETWFQPILTVDGAPFAHEALFRIIERDGAVIGPQRAFDVAKQAQLLFNLDLISRRSAVQTAARARFPGKLFVNFNPSSIYDPAYCLRTTASVVDTLGIQPRDVVFEVTESEEARDLRHLKGVLAFYRNAGFLVALDDVGSGYSSLNLLNEVRPDYMKLDMELARGVDRDPYKMNIVQHLIAIAQSNGTKVVAEGIETQAEADWMRAHGADYLQGYLFARPAPFETLKAASAA